MKWITKSNASLIELAASWLVVRFIDQKAEVLFADEKTIDQKISETFNLGNQK